MQNVRFQIIFYSILCFFVILLLVIIIFSFFGQKNTETILSPSPTEFPLKNGSINRNTQQLSIVSTSLDGNPISVTGFITVRFSAPINNGQLSIAISPQIDITKTFDYSLTTLTISPVHSWADSTTYTINVSKKPSSQDNQLLKPYQLQFRTETYRGY